MYSTLEKARAKEWTCPSQPQWEPLRPSIRKSSYNLPSRLPVSTKCSPDYDQKRSLRKDSKCFEPEGMYNDWSLNLTNTKASSNDETNSTSSSNYQQPKPDQRRCSYKPIQNFRVVILGEEIDGRIHSINDCDTKFSSTVRMRPPSPHCLVTPDF